MKLCTIGFGKSSYRFKTLLKLIFVISYWLFALFLIAIVVMSLGYTFPESLCFRLWSMPSGIEELQGLRQRILPQEVVERVASGMYFSDHLVQI